MGAAVGARGRRRRTSAQRRTQFFSLNGRPPAFLFVGTLRGTRAAAAHGGWLQRATTADADPGAQKDERSTASKYVNGTVAWRVAHGAGTATHRSTADRPGAHFLCVPVHSQLFLLLCHFGELAVVGIGRSPTPHRWRAGSGESSSGPARASQPRPALIAATEAAGGRGT